LMQNPKLAFVPTNIGKHDKYMKKQKHILQGLTTASSLPM
jgi:hypothetical protein